MILALLAAGADPNADTDPTPLYLSVVAGLPEAAQALLSAGADPSRRVRPNGWTPLHLAAFIGENRIGRVLLDGGADPNAEDRNGNTPLYYAALLGRIEIRQALVSAGGDLNGRNLLGHTPLKKNAAIRESAEASHLFVSTKGDPNVKNDSGQLPRKFAENQNGIDLVQEPVAEGADPDNAGEHADPEPKNSEMESESALASEDEDQDTAIDRSPVAPTPTRRQPEDEESGPAAIPDVGDDLSPRNNLKFLWNNLLQEKEKPMPTISIIGAPGSGKSHFATLLYIHLLSHPEIKVHVSHFGDARHNIINSAMRLEAGLPLEPTPKDLLVKNELDVRYEEWQPGPIFRPDRAVERVLRIPIMDSAGEMLQSAMENLLEARGDINPGQLAQKLESRYDPSLISDLFNHVFRADGFVFVVDVFREVDDPGNGILSGHTVMLQNLREYRQRHKELGSIKNSLVVLTKYDKLLNSMKLAVIKGHMGDLPDREFFGNNTTRHLVNQMKGAIRDGQGPNQADPVVPVILSSTRWATPPMDESEILDKYGDSIDAFRKQVLLDGRFEVNTQPDGSPVPAYDKDEYELIVDWLKNL